LSGATIVRTRYAAAQAAMALEHSLLLSIFTRLEIVGESGAVPGELRSVRHVSRSSSKRESSAGGVA
jgi:hypothetical protein